MGCKIENSPRQIPGGCDECSLTSPLFTLLRLRDQSPAYSRSTFESSTCNGSINVSSQWTIIFVLLTFFLLFVFRKTNFFNISFFDSYFSLNYQDVISLWKLCFLFDTIFKKKRNYIPRDRVSIVSNESIHGSVKLSPTCWPFGLYTLLRIILISDRSNCEFDARKINEPCCFPPTSAPTPPPAVPCFFSPRQRSNSSFVRCLQCFENYSPTSLCEAIRKPEYKR